MRACALFLFALTAVAQQPLRFEVASIRPTVEELNRVTVGFRMDRQQARMTAIPLGYYVSMAYEMKFSQIVGPPHLKDRFDIAATLPEGVKDDKLSEMMKGLLEERFQLKAHRESREMQVYVITAKEKVQLKALPDSDPSNPDGVVAGGGTGSRDGVSLDLGNGSSYSFANNQWEGKKLTLADVAEQLEQFLDHPVVDQTNLKGRYDLQLAVTADDYTTMRVVGSANAGFPVPPQFAQRLDAPRFDSLFEAFEKLGLKLEAKKLAQPILVVDSILKTPTEN